MVRKAVVARTRHDDVVQQWNAQQGRRLGQPERQSLIFLTGAAVAAWMIVGNDDRRHSLADQRSKNVCQADDYTIDLPYRSNVTTANPMTSIETKDVNRLLFGLA